jgi:hypothetical protein
MQNGGSCDGSDVFGRHLIRILATVTKISRLLYLEMDTAASSHSNSYHIILSAHSTDHNK